MNGNSPRRARIASSLPGRLRIKLQDRVPAQDPIVLNDVQDQLAVRDGIEHVRVNRANRSVTIHYDEKKHSAHGLLGLLEDVDIAIDSLVERARFGGDEESGESGRGPSSFAVAIAHINRRIRVSTGLPIQLNTLLPLMFLGAGVWSIVRSGLMIEKIPGWIFLWLALDVYTKLHPIHPPKERLGDRRG
jgi:hypothetical protein